MKKKYVFYLKGQTTDGIDVREGVPANSETEAVELFSANHETLEVDSVEIVASEDND